MEAVVMSAGKLGGGTGRGLAGTPAVVIRTSGGPVGGAEKMYSWVVTTSARVSRPDATPHGRLPTGKVCLALLAVRSMSVRALVGVAGATLLPKCATNSQWPSGDNEIDPG